MVARRQGGLPRTQLFRWRRSWSLLSPEPAPAPRRHTASRPLDVLRVRLLSAPAAPVSSGRPRQSRRYWPYRDGYTAVTDQLRQLRPAEHTRSRGKSLHQRANSPIPAFRHSPRSHHPHPPLKASSPQSSSSSSPKSKACWQRVPARFTWVRDVRFSGDSLPTPAWDRGIRDRHGLAVAGQRVTPSQELAHTPPVAARTCRRHAVIRPMPAPAMGPGTAANGGRVSYLPRQRPITAICPWVTVQFLQH